MDIYLATLYGGVVAGVGIGLVLSCGASTGGMDIPPLIVHKYTKIPISTLFLISDAFVVGLGLLSYDLPRVLIGFLSVYATSLAINKMMLLGGQKCKSVSIISPHTDEIIQLISDRLHRGCTVTKAVGGYTNEEKEMILVIISDNQYHQLIDLMNEIDKNAFIIVTDTTAVHGEGFSIQVRV